MDNLIYLANIILGITGFLVALNIFHKKKEQKPMVCPLNMKCEAVLYSKYSKFLGIPLEILGMLYYGLIIFSYSVFLLYPEFKYFLSVFIIFVLTTAGFLFSSYLISIQAFKLREWCSWCLMSTAISTGIFAITLQTNIIFTILSASIHDYELILMIIYALSATVGLCILIIKEIEFHIFLKDSVISEKESSTLHIFSQLTWLALGIMTLSNYVLYLIDPSILTTSSGFTSKIIILLAIIVINLFYDLFVSSRLIAYITGMTISILWLSVLILEIL